MNEPNPAALPSDAELVDATDISVGDRIIRHRRIEEVARIKSYKHTNDDTLEFELLSESHGCENVLFSSQDMIFKVAAERPDTRPRSSA
nr:MAG TPA: hypothetical protein [Caudoviricetes sp.]